ncbi:MAG TPA: hypothetical protein VM032_14390 [Vicinamibacterales bacterium]|nr:hypothetical protein [Vicinamibacterales bacterium]
MTTITRTRTLAAAASAAAIAIALSTSGSAAAPRFFDDDPVWMDKDSENAAGLAPLEVDLVTDLAVNIIAGSAPRIPVRAANLNTVDEVPDSSWFTNRAGRVALSAADVTRGPDRTSGPAPGPWTVSSSKSDGVTPGFTVKDSMGRRWFLKFDPPGFRGMSTGTEVAATKLMWALGYNVPENHIAYLHRDQLVVGPTAKFTPAGGRTRAMRPGDIDRLLERADREPDGSYRVVASLALEGTPVGRIRFQGTRSDDPNDVVPHEDRRELRGYGVFAAWLNHVDAKAINSLDTLVTENGRAFVRHHLIDFGSSLGSGGVGPADRWAGAQYLVEPSVIGKQMIGFGLVLPRWQRAAFYESPSIGRLPRENAAFDPRSWKPRVPNQAFLHARPDDQFWAAQKLASLNVELLRAAVAAGDFRDPASEAFLVRALAERRDAIMRAYLPGLNPVSAPALDADGTLSFRNAAVDADVARAPRGYDAVWHQFDNATGAARFIGTSQSAGASMQAPRPLPAAEGAFVRVEISSDGADQPAWSYPVHAYFRLHSGSWQLVGFERMPDRS